MEEEPAPPKRKRGRPSEKSKKAQKKSSSEESKDQEMEEEVPAKVITPFIPKPKETKREPERKAKSSSKKEKKIKEADLEEAKSVTKTRKRHERGDTESQKSKGSKMYSEGRHHKVPDSKRRKTEKGEKYGSLEKKKPKKIEWQYGKYCPRENWVGKTVKVKFPAENQVKGAKFEVGTIKNFRTDENGYKNLFEVEFQSQKKKWVNLKDSKMYVFGQVIQLRYSEDPSQIAVIKEAYGFSGSKKTAIPVPVIELIECEYLTGEEAKTSSEETSEKIPIQYFFSEKAKKILPEHIIEFSDFSEEEDKIIAKEWAKGEKIIAEIQDYHNRHLAWVQKYSCIELDPDVSLKEYIGRVVRVFKDDQYLTKNLVLRVINEEKEGEIVYIRNLKNSKSKWVNLKETDTSKGGGFSFKLDQIKGMVTYDSLRNTIYPKVRMALPYVFTHHDERNKILIEQAWKFGDPFFENGVCPANEEKGDEPCKACDDKIGMSTYLYCDLCQRYFHSG